MNSFRTADFITTEDKQHIIWTQRIRSSMTSENLDSTHNSVGTFDRSTSKKKDNGKAQGTTDLSEVFTDNRELS